MFLILAIASCSSLNIEQYKDQGPAFDFENFFSGGLVAEGFFQDRKGVVIKKIVCQMNAVKEGDTIVIYEDFVYSDGKKEKRTWKIKKNSAGKYEGTAEDVIGVAKIETSGFAFNMKYTLQLKLEDSTIDVSMDDWMYKINDTMVLNKTKMSKWGFNLGEVILTIKKK